MAKGKMKLELIADEKARARSYKKRKAGLLKKVREISILCGIDICVLIYLPNSHTADILSPNPNEAASILQRYKSLSGFKRSLRRFDLQSFLREQEEKQIEKIKKEIELEIEAYRRLYFEFLFMGCLSGDYDVGNLSSDEITTLILLVEIKMGQIDARLEKSNGQQRDLIFSNNGFSPLMQEPLTFPDLDFYCMEEFAYRGVEPYFPF